MDATPPLVDGDVEHRALEGDQPGVEGCSLIIIKMKVAMMARMVRSSIRG